MRYKQYEVILVNLDPTIGAEIKKTRPCVIISPDEMNFSNVIVAPMTSKYKDYPTRVKIDENSYIVLDQIRTISIKRIIKKLDIKLSPEDIKEIKKIIKIMLVD
ncbi:type II toxin-antitoxin system PemK/MazF family toxin [Nitrosophilus kaiyonis]|uniref:type II toxin-antitoxin system PemK/MazF family toxin n=1 Tax=Nitrosophilus kaiyonis TaxID=2930200 RepID=UPI00248F57C0|nr:type II toxin-antitoxin system PemK/MazF family toxin [Nitrosophilus kaiyonis]